MAKTKTHNEFINQLYSINKNITIISKYVNSNDKVKCKCNICNNEWMASPAKLLAGRSCPMCAKKKVADSRRNNIEQVKNRLMKVNPNINIIGEYSSCDKPVECECLMCGFRWFPTVSNLYAGKGCPKCSKSYHRTNEEFVEEIKNINPGITLLESFINTATRIKCKCKKCGFIWNASPSSLLQGHGCAKCSNVLKRDASEFKKSMQKKYFKSNIIILGDYINANTPILCQCKKCKITWNARVNTLMKGTHCPQCDSKKRLKTTNYFKQEVEKINPLVEILGDYKQAHKKIQTKCKKCGYEFYASPHSLLQGHGCPQCAKIKISNCLRKSNEDFLKELKSIQPDINILEEYEKSNKPIKCSCKNCNYIWKAKPNDLLSGKGCPNCTGFSGTSFVEQLIYLALTTALDKEKVLNRNKKMLGIELDIYVPSLNFAIEFGSWFWHKNKVKNDKRKIDICAEKGIELIIIYDSCNISKPPFNKNCHIVKENLSEQKNYEILKKLIINIMKQYNLETDIFVQKYDKLIIEAKRLSKRRGTKKFKEELKIINPNIEIIGEFQRVREKIKCRCKVCDYVWDGIPSGLLSGRGCPRCGGNWRKTHEEYVEQVKNINNKVKVIGRYNKDNDKIECECLICGFKWSPMAGSLIQGHGCPKCAKKRIAKKFGRSHEQFVKELKQKNKKIRVLGKYINARTKIECECLVCHHIWFANPDTLINRGSGCPKCAKKSVGEYKKKN